MQDCVDVARRSTQPFSLAAECLHGDAETAAVVGEERGIVENEERREADEPYDQACGLRGRLARRGNHDAQSESNVKQTMR